MITFLTTSSLQAYQMLWPYHLDKQNPKLKLFLSKIIGEPHPQYSASSARNGAAFKEPQRVMSTPNSNLPIIVLDMNAKARTFSQPTPCCAYPDRSSPSRSCDLEKCPE